MMGNRGVLRAGREFEHRHWVCCVRDFKRDLAVPRQYTKLFFIDEATALAAGHRPCGTCRRTDYNDFKAAWIRANSEPWSTVDEVLHRERVGPRREFEFDSLPDGCMVEWTGEPHLVRGDSLLLWTHGGYAGRVERPKGALVKVLTPASIVRTLRAGYVAKCGSGTASLPKS